MGTRVTTSPAIAYCHSHSFELFEQFAAASRDWNMDFRQLSASQNPFCVQQLRVSDMLLDRASLDSRFHQRGGPTIGFRTFALHAHGCSDFRWCGERVDAHSLVVMSRDGQFESVSQPGFDVFTVSLSTELLERTAEVEFQRPLADFIGPGGEIRYYGGSTIREILHLLHLLSESVGSGRDFVAARYGTAGLADLKRTLAYLILYCLECTNGRSPREPRSKRQHALNRAIEIIDQTPAADLCLSHLVEQVGVSRRTLEYAFLDGLDMPPASYLKVLKLGALNRELVNTSPGDQSVAAISASHGFVHAGQLAADYRKMFGESPSVTLLRPSARYS